MALSVSASPISGMHGLLVTLQTVSPNQHLLCNRHLQCKSVSGCQAHTPALSSSATPVSGMHWLLGTLQTMVPDQHLQGKLKVFKLRGAQHCHACWLAADTTVKQEYRLTPAPASPH